MHRPVEPSKEECCNSGCNPCILDVYHRQLQLYEKQASGQLHTSLPKPNNLIAETKYTPFRITYIKEICQDHWILAFSYYGERQKGELYWKPGQHFLMKFTSGNSSLSKAYTPLRLPEWPKEIDCDFLIIVKKYIRGIVSNFLCSKKIGEEVLWRGPYGSFDHIANKYKRLCMIAQGTGIAPFYSIIKVVLDNEDDFTNLILLCCYKSIDKILLRKELYALRQYWNFNYKIFLGENLIKAFSIMYKEPVEHRKLDINYLKEIMWPSQNDAFLVCGSIEFMNYYIDHLQKAGVENGKIINF